MMVMVVMVRILLLSSDVPQVPIFADELIHPPVKFLYSGTLGLDETLLVLDDGGELPQVQNRLHWVFQKAGAHTQDVEEEEWDEKRIWTEGWRTGKM